MAKILCFGEILLRMAAGDGDLLTQARALAVHVGGAEANVAAALAQLGHDAAMLSILPESRLGDSAIAALCAHGVDTRWIRRCDGRMGLYFLEPGAGVRPGEIIYDRAGSAFAETVGTADWGDALTGAQWLHLSGITPALTPAAAQATLNLVRAARAAGISISLDCNYRRSLWAASGGDAPALLGALAGEADLLFGNHRDVTLMTDTPFSGEGRARAAAETAFAAFPGLKMIASTDRRVASAQSQHLSARIDTRDDAVQLDEIALDGIVDRIGAGDAFAAGVLHGVITTGDPACAARFGLAAVVQKHFIRGDMWIGRPADLDALPDDAPRDIRR